MRYTRHLTATVTAMLLCATPAMGAAAQGCSCQNRDSNANGRIAGALGGGLFAGLIAAVLGVKHVAEAAPQPTVGAMGSAAPGIAPTIAVSTGTLAPPDSSSGGSTAMPERAASLAMAPAPAAADPASGAAGSARAPTGARDMRGPARTMGRMPPMSASEARQAGLIPPKTASLLPAFAMIGAGSLLLGLLLLRERARGGRGVRRRRR